MPVDPDDGLDELMTYLHERFAFDNPTKLARWIAELEKVREHAWRYRDLLH